MMNNGGSLASSFFSSTDRGLRSEVAQASVWNVLDCSLERYSEGLGRHWEVTEASKVWFLGLNVASAVWVLTKDKWMCGSQCEVVGTSCCANAAYLHRSGRCFAWNVSKRSIKIYANESAAADEIKKCGASTADRTLVSETAVMPNVELQVNAPHSVCAHQKLWEIITLTTE